MDGHPDTGSFADEQYSEIKDLWQARLPALDSALSMVVVPERGLAGFDEMAYFPSVRVTSASSGSDAKVSGTRA